jgi:hypothetical protein
MIRGPTGKLGEEYVEYDWFVNRDYSILDFDTYRHGFDKHTTVSEKTKPQPTLDCQPARI